MSFFIIVEIRDTLSGISGLYADTYDWVDGEGVEYMWSDGNSGCDCNRSIFLSCALGGTWDGDPKFPELGCNLKDNTLLVIVRERGSGRVIYSEMENKEDFVCMLPVD